VTLTQLTDWLMAQLLIQPQLIRTPRISDDLNRTSLSSRQIVMVRCQLLVKLRLGCLYACLSLLQGSKSDL
jgi:hypothetical protein